jgi:sigma-B regulation protein RsbU (phosphoserine phosphatase)
VHSDIPFDSASESTSFTQSRLGEDLTTARILVVDDNRAARGLIALHLRSSGFTRISLVADGFEALKAMDAVQPELIITDLLMPNMNGLELCRRLRVDPKTSEIPVLAQTGSTDPDLRAQAFACGATDLLAKPFDPRELLYRVRILLERGRLIERLSEFQRRMADELRQAAAIQEALLPSQALLERLKAVCPMDVAGHYEASEGLGGDIWGIELVGDRRVMIFNADFAGHGLSAALNTMRLHSFINGGPEKSRSPAALLTQLNRFLCDVLPLGQYATMFCGVMDFRACSLEYASAAAPPQLLRCAAGSPFEIFQEPGFPLGVTRDATYENFAAPFAPGATLLLFSDALIETPAPPDAAFTETSLCDFVESIAPAIHPHDPPRFVHAFAPVNGPHELRDGVLREFFSRISEKPEDDLTMVAAHHLIVEEPR